MVQVQCRLQHHGAAASSGSNALTWLKQGNGDSSSSSSSSSTSSTLVYASHSILNLAGRSRVALHNGVQEDVWHVEETLRTCTQEKSQDASRIVTSVAAVKGCPSGIAALASGFSDGTILLWCRSEDEWTEFTAQSPSRSVTTLDGRWIRQDELLLVSGSSGGATVYRCHLRRRAGESRESTFDFAVTSVVSLTETAVSSVHFPLSKGQGACSTSNSSSLVFVGTAAHRHNKIHAYQLLCNEKDSRGEEKTNSLMSHYAGSLIGHEDWITCFDWSDSAVNGMKVSVLASGSQDARIRLWNFSSTTTSTADAVVDDTPAVTEIANDSDDDDDSVDNDVAEDDEEGESRLEIVDPYDPSVVTRVTLEALLIAHEESVTSVTWHPDPRQVYGIDLLLISSSMDRTILLWGPASDDGIWTPLTRVGSAGGILGGSVGSSLLGFCRASVEPEQGRCLVGHAYGGTLHFWSLDEPERDNTEKKDNPLNEMPTEERAALVQWKATPCLTGHFNGVTDLCWEASAGEYLLTVSNDQTCRLWAPVAKADEDGDAAPIWVELARPQVHGYDLSAVASLSTETHPHLLVTGADEKELRAFDAPKTTTRILKAVTGYLGATDEAAKERVERAYIPSLGLSNKASASEGAEEDKVDAVERSLESSTVESMRLPLERDLGAVSLWPEIQKFFGHNTEIYCLASTLAGGNVLLASSAKARDVDAAAIRLWNVCEGKCVQVLSGGHKSTVATLSFSANGWFLASAGKDRRLCIWKRSETNQCDYSLVWARDSAHKRIIWSVHFCLFDDAVLLSGSRDGCMKAWRLEDAGDESLQVTEMHSFAPSFHRSDGKPDSVTALSVCPVPMDQNGTALLAVGLESGRIELWQVPLAMQSRSETPQLVTALTPGQCHISTVTKLAWKPFKNDVSPEAKKTLLLASSSMDHGCRIFEVSIEG